MTGEEEGGEILHDWEEIGNIEHRKAASKKTVKGGLSVPSVTLLS